MTANEMVVVPYDETSPTGTIDWFLEASRILVESAYRRGCADQLMAIARLQGRPLDPAETWDAVCVNDGVEVGPEFDVDGSVYRDFVHGTYRYPIARIRVR